MAPSGIADELAAGCSESGLDRARAFGLPSWPGSWGVRPQLQATTVPRVTLPSCRAHLTTKVLWDYPLPSDAMRAAIAFR